MHTKLEKHFGNWKNRREIKSTKKLVSKKSNGIKVRFINSPDLSKPTIRIAMPAVSIENPDFLSFYSAFHIIGKGRNSRIYNSINSIPGNWERVSSIKSRSKLIESGVAVTFP